MRKFFVAALALPLAGALMLGGCSKKPAAGGAQGAAAKQTALVAIAMPETHLERWKKDGATLKRLTEEKGYRAEVQFGNADQSEQNRQISSFLTNGAKILIVASVNDGVGAAVAEAKRSNVPLIAYDRIIQNTNEYAYYLTFNNYKVGTLQGEAIRDALKLDEATAAAPKIITLFAGSPTDANAGFFFNGAIDVLNPYVEKGVLKIVGPYPKQYTDKDLFQKIATENWTATVAKTRMELLLGADARDVILDAVLAPNDTMARAIIEALKADAKYHTKLPFVTGQDAEFDSCLSIKLGEQSMTVFKDTNKLAEAAVIVADAIARGVKPEVPNAIEIYDEGPLKGIADVTPGDLADNLYVHTFLLDPIAVSKSNLNVILDAGYYTGDQAAQLK